MSLSHRAFAFINMRAMNIEQTCYSHTDYSSREETNWNVCDNIISQPVNCFTHRPKINALQLLRIDYLLLGNNKKTMSSFY